MFVSWFGLPFCACVLFANRSEPVHLTRPRACLGLLATHVHSQGAAFYHYGGCVAVISASRNNLVLIFFAWVFSTHVQQPLRCVYTRAETRKERCEHFAVNIASTIMHQIYGSGAMPMQVRIKVRRRFGPCGCCIQSYVECCGSRHDTHVT